jgi:hypothetical protein
VIDLFFSYAHHDEELRNELEIHLSMLKRNGLIRAWHDRRITAGKELEAEISEHLESADVILLLLSPHFLASDYCYESEATRALERHEQGNAVVIPVILQPCDWAHSPFRKLRATPHDGKPVTKFPNINDAFLQVAQDIREAAESLHKSENVVRKSLASSDMVKTSSGPRSSNLRLKKTFSDHERDRFLDEAYRYIEKFFENSLNELRDRNPGVEFSLKKMTATDFTAAVYVHGAKRTGCHIWLPGSRSFGGDIAYAANDSPNTNSINDGFRVEDDGYQLGLKTTGMAMMHSSADAPMTSQGAAEYFWSVFISHLQ